MTGQRSEDVRTSMDRLGVYAGRGIAPADPVMEVTKLAVFVAKCSLCSSWSFRYGSHGVSRSDASVAFREHVAERHIGRQLQDGET